MKPQANKAPVFLALDINDGERALSLVRQTHSFILGYKIGPRLFFNGGKDLIRRIQPFGKIFLDFKFYDIPSSTVSAVRAAFYLGADYVTIHSAVGMKTLKQLAVLENELNKRRRFRVLCVTVLSSVSGDFRMIQKRTMDLAKDVFRSGLTGLVCSPREVESLRTKYPRAFLVTPGIRFEGDERGDQARVTAPAEALKKGSSALVMGRSLLQDPQNRCRELVRLLKDL